MHRRLVMLVVIVLVAGLSISFFRARGASTSEVLTLGAAAAVDDLQPEWRELELTMEGAIPLDAVVSNKFAYVVVETPTYRTTQHATLVAIALDDSNRSQKLIDSEHDVRYGLPVRNVATFNDVVLAFGAGKDPSGETSSTTGLIVWTIDDGHVLSTKALSGGLGEIDRGGMSVRREGDAIYAEFRERSGTVTKSFEAVSRDGRAWHVEPRVLSTRAPNDTSIAPNDAVRSAGRLAGSCIGYAANGSVFAAADCAHWDRIYTGPPLEVVAGSVFGERAVLVRADSSLLLVDTHLVVTEEHLVLGPMSLSPVHVFDNGDSIFIVARRENPGGVQLVLAMSNDGRSWDVVDLPADATSVSKIWRDKETIAVVERGADMTTPRIWIAKRDPKR